MDNVSAVVDETISYTFPHEKTANAMKIIRSKNAVRMDLKFLSEDLTQSVDKMDGAELQSTIYKWAAYRVSISGNEITVHPCDILVVYKRKKIGLFRLSEWKQIALCEADRKTEQMMRNPILPPDIEDFDWESNTFLLGVTKGENQHSIHKCFYRAQFNGLLPTKVKHHMVDLLSHGVRMAILEFDPRWNRVEVQRGDPILVAEPIPGEWYSICAFDCLD